MEILLCYHYTCQEWIEDQEHVPGPFFVGRMRLCYPFTHPYIEIAGSISALLFVQKGTFGFQLRSDGYAGRHLDHQYPRS